MSALIGPWDQTGKRDIHWQTKAHAAATATEDLQEWRAPVAVSVSEIRIIPSVAATGHDTVRTDINFINRGSDGLGTTACGNVDFVAGVDCVASVPIAVTVTAFTMAAGDVLVPQAEKVSTGLAIGACTIQIICQPT